MNFLSDFGKFLSVFDPTNVNNKQGGSNRKQSPRATNVPRASSSVSSSRASSAPTSPRGSSSRASSAPTSPRGSSENSSSFRNSSLGSSKTYPPTRPKIYHVGLKAPEEFNEKQFESFKEKLIKSEDIKHFEQILSENKNKLTPSQKKDLQDLLVSMLESKNQKIDVSISQLKKDLKTQREQQDKLSNMSRNASSRLNSSTRRYTNAVGSSRPRDIDNLRGEIDKNRFISDVMSENLATKDNQVNSLSEQMRKANDIKEANKEKISLLNGLTQSSRSKQMRKATDTKEANKEKNSLLNGLTQSFRISGG